MRAAASDMSAQTSAEREAFDVERERTRRQLADQVRDLLQPGTSALFLIVEKVTPDKAVDALSRYGGTVLKSSLSKDAEAELQDALHGSQAAA